MTQAMAITQTQDGEAVDGAGADSAASHLAAIQHSYEEARACIVDPSRTPSYPAQDCVDAYPDTEAIDLDAVLPPVPLNAAPPTDSMSVAARYLAERQVVEGMGWQATGSGPGGDDSPVPAGSRWWRAIRATFGGAAAGRSNS
jgi:hypothetical protein